MKKFLTLLAALALVAAACGSDSDPEVSATTTAAPDDNGDTPTTEATPAPTGTEAGSGGEILLLQWQAPSQANPLLSSGTKDIQAASLVLEPLAETAPDGSLVAALAAEIPTEANGGISADKTSITWKLKEGVLWSDGTPLTADDALFTYEYCTNEATGCSNESFADVANVTADDDLTLTVTFNEPTAYPFVPFVTASTPIIQRAQFAECVGEAAKSCSEQNFMPIGTGPFMVTELRPEDTVTYTMNPNYRGIPDGKPFFGSATIKGGGDAEASARSVLEVGEADYAWNLQVAPEVLASMEAAGKGKLVSGFASGVEHIHLNQTDPNADPRSDGTPHPLFVNNPDLHRALSIAINRDDLVTVGYGPSGAPTCNIWPVGVENSTNNDWCLTQNIEEANSLLDGLGYLDTDGDGVREAEGFGPLEFDYFTSTNAVRQSNQELVKDNWAEIGVNANIKNEDASLFFDGTCASDACIWKFYSPIQMYTNNSTTPDGVDYMGGFISSQIPTAATSWGGENITRFNSAEYDALEAEAKTVALDDPRRVELIIEMNDLVTSLAVIPLIHRASASAFSNEIGGTGDLNGWDTEYWNIEEWFRN